MVLRAGSRGKLGSTTNAKSVRTIFELRAIQVQKGRHLAAPRKLSIVVCNKNAAEGAISIVEVGKTALRSAPPTTNQRARICESSLRTVPSTNRRARFCGPRASGARRYRRLSAEPPQPSKSQTKVQSRKKSTHAAIFRLTSNNILVLVKFNKFNKSFVREEPFDLIKNLPLVGESYQEALKLLKNRYENKNRIVNEHICNLLDLRTVGKSTASNLREFVSAIRQQVAAIKNHNPNIIYWDHILTCIILRKLDGYTSRAYQLERDLDAEPSLEDLLCYLDKRALALEGTDQSHHQQPQARYGKVAAHAAAADKPPTCLNCKSTNHKLFNCKQFQLMASKERIDFVKQNKLCNVCLGAHFSKCRFHFRCAECKGPHNTLVHYNEPALAPPVTLTGNNNSNVLLPTARVKAIAKDGTEVHFKALLDSGSQVSIVTSKLVQLLGLTPKQSATNIIGISNAKNHLKYCVPLEIHSLKSTFKTTVTCHVTDQITSQLPQSKIKLDELQLPSNIEWADEQFNVPSDIHMLMGANIMFQVLLPEKSSVTPANNSGKQSPAQNDLHIFNTHFGHIIGGSLPTGSIKGQILCNKVVLKCEMDLNETLGQFWTNEKVPEIFSEKSPEHELCEQIFQNSVELKDKQFQVPLPLKLPLSEVKETLGDSFNLALKRFHNLEKKLMANPELFMQYKQFIHEFLSLGHGHYVDIEMYDINKQAAYYMPHHAIIKPESKTTKVRSVFDASMKTNKKVSLNDLQLNGPVVQRDLFDIMLLFRLGRYTITSDIKRMFRNILVDPAFTSLQNILWRDDPSQPIKCIRLDRVTYGLKSSSYLATRCLIELANRYENEYPLAAFILRNNTYVDDVLYSHNDLATVREAKQQLCSLLSLGSFNTHKWSSNNELVLSDIPLEDQHFDSIDLQKDNYNMKTLGLQINTKEDNFIITSPGTFDTNLLTKRSILSYIGRCYDPIGFINPIIVVAKSIMQKLWINNTDWNSCPPTDVEREWIQFTEDLRVMEPIQINRNVRFSDEDTVELIGFADASSSTAHGCCIYLRVTTPTGNTTLHLLCSKSRINPIQKKGMTVPRLELNAALLLSKLMSKTYDTLKLKVNVSKVYLFSDSQIVLAWLKMELTNLQAYVANRVNVIRQHTVSWQWLYISTDNNPADLVSRGVRPHELSSCEQWWHGPRFLNDSEYNFPITETNTSSDLPEVKHCLVLSSDHGSHTGPLEQKATVAKQLMGSLPASRVTSTNRAFVRVGVDFAGPIDVKLSRGVGGVGRSWAGGVGACVAGGGGRGVRVPACRRCAAAASVRSARRREVDWRARAAPGPPRPVQRAHSLHITRLHRSNHPKSW
ncbi:unnamed protein product [Plutella xylostella]|uniref:(diamondback moth) hypothetical protein n=1 Tax=Plutella xylostella TaxID=51655 RepID=A0A8S4G4L0_PLUXY|nr:unnamed protein product [Plutella xylostella]